MFSRKRLLTAVESLGLQAIPWQDLDVSVDIPVLHSLAGNAWTGTVAMAVFFSMIVHIPLPTALSKMTGEISD